MVSGKQLQKALERFMRSPVCKEARVQIELPNGEHWDLTTMQLLENTILGSNETHRILLKCQKPVYRMGKIIGKL
jgi:hypothetical protein